MTRPSRSATATCVVCLWPVGNECACGKCGWEVGRTDLLAEAQYRWDLAAAERAVVSDAEREQLRAYLRGTDPGDAVPDPASAGGNGTDPPALPPLVIGDATQVV